MFTRNAPQPVRARSHGTEEERIEYALRSVDSGPSRVQLAISERAERLRFGRMGVIALFTSIAGLTFVGIHADTDASTEQVCATTVGAETIWQNGVEVVAELRDKGASIGFRGEQLTVIDEIVDSAGAAGVQAGIEVCVDTLGGQFTNRNGSVTVSLPTTD